MNTPTNKLTSLTHAWLALIALTFASLVLGKWSTTHVWLPMLMAIVIWTKCAIVADRFIEANQAHPAIRRIVHVFIAFAPIALILVILFGSEIRRWTSLE